MDDIIDLELEKIDAIIAKIDADTMPEYLKVVDRKLWSDIRRTAEQGKKNRLRLYSLG